MNGCLDRCDLFFHEKTCNCQEYTGPALTITKIGLALHVKFKLEDGSYSYIDCDINFPTVPTSTPYYPNAEEFKQDFLIKTRPVGWLEEFSKTENSRFISYANWADRPEYDKDWQVKMRMLNRDIVIPSQV